MKKICLIALVAMTSTVAMAQAHNSTSARPSQEVEASKSGGPAADAAQRKTDAKKGGTSTMGSKGNNNASWRAMDTNGDGMISQAEYNAYHAGVWGKMKHTNGMVSMQEMDAMMRGGPN